MKKRKFGRLPNGYGTIMRMRAKLRNPYIARKRVGTSPDGRPIYKTIGSFSTYTDAYNAVLSSQTADNVSGVYITMKDLYNRLYAALSDNSGISEESLSGYRYSYAAVPQLHDRPFLSLTAEELQNAILAAGGSASRQVKIKLLFSKLYQYAGYIGLTDRNLAEYIRITKKDAPKRNPFTCDEVLHIWSMPESRWRNATLIMLYTGLRVGELFTVHDITDRTFRAGLKTEAGINRLVPIHPDIRDIFMRTFPMDGTPNLAQKWYRRNLQGHTPHDCRRTFITRADECGVNPTACRQIVGHSSGDVHEIKYTIHPAEYLYEEICKLTYEKRNCPNSSPFPNS